MPPSPEEVIPSHEGFEVWVCPRCSALVEREGPDKNDTLRTFGWAKKPMIHPDVKRRRWFGNRRRTT